MRFRSSRQRKAVMAKYRRLQIEGNKVRTIMADGKIVGVHAVEKGSYGSRFFMSKGMYARGKLPATYVLVRGVRYYG
jgi:hypothetical protein